MERPEHPVTLFAKLFPTSRLPERKTDGAAGFDLHAHVERRQYGGTVVYPGKTIVVWCGIAVAIPTDHVGLVCSRSGLTRQGIVVVGAPGIIDPDYRGEVAAPLMNVGEEPFEVEDGMRIAQLLVVKNQTSFREMPDVLSLGTTARASRGFGSTGSA